MDIVGKLNRKERKKVLAKTPGRKVKSSTAMGAMVSQGAQLGIMTKLKSMNR